MGDVRAANTVSSYPVMGLPVLSILLGDAPCGSYGSEVQCWFLLDEPLDKCRDSSGRLRCELHALKLCIQPSSTDKGGGLGGTGPANLEAYVA